MTTRRVALYARVSTTNGQDVGLQVEELRLLAAQREWVIVDVFEDVGVSGSTDSRPALDRMLAAARSGKVDVVAVWKLDRLGRSLKHLLGVLDDLTAWDVGFVSARDSGIDSTTPSGRLMLQMLGAFAEFERELIRERVVAGVRRAQAGGTHCGRPRVEVDLRPTLALLGQGRSLREVSAILGIPRKTLRRRLDEAGQWPVAEVAT